MSHRRLIYRVVKLEKEYGKTTRYGHIVSSRGRRLTTTPMMEKDAIRLIHHYNAYLDIEPKLRRLVDKWNI